MTSFAAFPADGDVFRAQRSIFAEEVVAEGRRVVVGDLLRIFKQLQFGDADGDVRCRVDDGRLDPQEIRRQRSEGR